MYRNFLILIIGVFSCGFLNAQDTSVMIRVQSKDAKFIGSSIGGAKVIIREEITGNILAEGLTTGSTGNTETIMNAPWERGKRLTDEETAGFLAELDIKEPVFVTVEAIAPISKKQARVTSSTQLWILPGKHITGEGIVLEVPGFVVDILSPQTHERINTTSEIEISANIVMMCGCPVVPDGTWDANKYEIKAIVRGEGTTTAEIDLKAHEKPSTFSGKLSLVPGNYSITVYAFDPKTGNTGLDKTTIIIN